MLLVHRHHKRNANELTLPGWGGPSRAIRLAGRQGCRRSGRRLGWRRSRNNPWSLRDRRSWHSGGQQIHSGRGWLGRRQGRRRLSLGQRSHLEGESRWSIGNGDLASWRWRCHSGWGGAADRGGSSWRRRGGFAAWDTTAVARRRGWRHSRKGRRSAKR